MDPMVGRFIMEERNVSSYVLEMFALDAPIAGSVSAQARLMAVRLHGNLDGKDKVMIVFRALKHICRQHLLKELKICLDEADAIVYGLCYDDDFTAVHRAWKISLDSDGVCFNEVKSIVLWKDSHSDFFGIAVRIKVVSPQNSLVPDAEVPFTLDNEDVSLFVVDYLGLVPGQQNRLIAAKGLSSVKLVARGVRQNRGKEWLAIYKFVLDFENGTVYVLVKDEENANMMAGRSFLVGGGIMSLYRVLSIGVRAKAEDSYQSFRVDKIWPFTYQPPVYGS